MQISNIKNTLPAQLQLQKVQQGGENFEDTLTQALASQDDEELKEACKQIEQYMLTSIFKQMKASTQIGEPLVEKGDYEKMFEDYLVDEQCKMLVEAGGVGLSDMMYKQLNKN